VQVILQRFLFSKQAAGLLPPLPRPLHPLSLSFSPSLRSSLPLPPFLPPSTSVARSLPPPSPRTPSPSPSSPASTHLSRPKRTGASSSTPLLPSSSPPPSLLPPPSLPPPLLPPSSLLPPSLPPPCLQGESQSRRPCSRPLHQRGARKPEEEESATSRRGREGRSPRGRFRGCRKRQRYVRRWGGGIAWSWARAARAG
jgi:hypothetical protein